MGFGVVFDRSVRFDAVLRFCLFADLCYMFCLFSFVFVGVCCNLAIFCCFHIFVIFVFASPGERLPTCVFTYFVCFLFAECLLCVFGCCFVCSCFIVLCALRICCCMLLLCFPRPSHYNNKYATHIKQ
jgi:hypothetical protein